VARLAEAVAVDHQRMPWPCDVPNVVVITSETRTEWYGNVAGREMYRDILDWASASGAARRLLDLPKSFEGHAIDPFRKDVTKE